MTDIATTGGNLPALATTPALEIDGSDISLPRLYKAEYQGGQVQDGNVPAGSIFTASSKDDPNPEVIVADATKADEEGVLVHILGMHKNLSASVDGELQNFPFGSPDAPADARVGYNYVVVLPEVDEDVPVKFLLNKTSEGVAKRINFLLKKNEATTPAWGLAFRLKLRKRESEKGGQKFRWFVWTEKQVEANPEHVEIAERLAPLAAGAVGNDIETTAPAGDQPAI